MEDDYRACPLCAERIRTAAIKCRHCGSDVREDAVANFLGESGGTDTSQKPATASTSEDTSESSRAAIAIGRLSLGIIGHYLFLPALFLLSAGTAEVGSGLKALGALVLAAVYGMIGFGWLGMSTKHSHLHVMCATACFLAVLCLVVFAFSGAPAGTEQTGLHSSLKGVFGAHAFYMLALGLWYHAGGVKSLISFRGLTETSSLVIANNLIYTGFTYLVFVSILITSLFTPESDAEHVSSVIKISVFVAVLGGIICTFRPINHFKGMRRTLEEAEPMGNSKSPREG